MKKKYNLNLLIKNSYDLHFHIGFDVRPRRFTTEELARKDKGKIAGIVVKSHGFSTVPMTVELAQKIKKNGWPKLFGSITLNNFVGGMTSDVVYASATVSKEPIFVWFPTIHAVNNINGMKKQTEFEIPPAWSKDPNFKARKLTEVEGIRVVDKNGRLKKEVIGVLKMVKKMNCILATGHLSWQESVNLVKGALKIGIRNVIVTHPMQRHIIMPLKEQKKLAKLGAYIETCYIMFKDGKGFYKIEEIVKQIREIGPRQFLITSDGGQVGNPSSSDCLKRFCSLLLKNGISFSQLEQILIKNPEKILKV